MDRHCRLPLVSWKHGRTASFRLRNILFSLPLLQQLCIEHGLAVQANVAMAKLHIRRECVYFPQPDGEIIAGLAGVRWHACA